MTAATPSKIPSPTGTQKAGSKASANRSRLARPRNVRHETAVWVTIGLGLLFAGAAVIEGFVSPFYWRPFL